MDRLTARNENGEAYYKRCYESPCDGTGEACDNCNFIDEVLCERLAAFEDNGITPEQMREISRLYQIKCEEVAAYEKVNKLLSQRYGCNTDLIEFAEIWLKAVGKVEGKDPFKFCILSEEDYYKWKEHKQAEEQGRLIELPCKVEDEVWVKMQSGNIAKAEVRDYTHFLTYGFCAVLTSKSFDKVHIPFSEIGKTVFLTKEEAEQALKKRGE